MKQKFLKGVLSLVLSVAAMMYALSAQASYNRIISLYPAHTENLARMGAADQIVGIGTTDDFPPSITTKPRFAPTDDAEKFISLHPDLILVRPMVERSKPELMKKFRTAGITVISIQPKNMKELFSYWKELGKLSGHEKEADEMVSDFQKKRSAIKENTAQWLKTHNGKKPRVYFESMHSKSRTIADNSIAAFVLDSAGGENIAADAEQVRTTNIAYYPKEKLLAKGAEIDVFIAQQGHMNPITKKVIEDEPGYKAINAVKNGKIFLVPEELVSRPTFRIIDGVKLLNGILYPEMKK